MTPTRRLGLIVSVLLGTALVAAEQQPRFTSRVEQVRVDVLATAGGQPVVGLEASDFEIRDNGVRQDVKLVSADTTPVNVIVALDTSSSLTAERLSRLRNASRALVRKLKPDESAGLITFSHVISVLQPMTTAVGRIDEALARVSPAGDTALIDATYLGLSLAEEGTGRALLVVFSDGLDTASWQPANLVVRAARRFETVLYAVAVASEGRPPQFLRDVANATGGKVLEVRANDNLEQAFAQILDEFRQRYLLSYAPSGVSGTGWHRIEVRVKRRGVTARARPGYFAK